MRSRDGNSPLLRTIALILFTLVSLEAQEYLISYRYVVKDAILYNEKLDISPAMKKCKGEPQKEFILQDVFGKDLKRKLKNSPEEFIDYIHKLGLHVNYQNTNIDSISSSSIIMTLRTTCFKVDFNENFAKIAPLK